MPKQSQSQAPSTTPPEVFVQVSPRIERLRVLHVVSRLGTGGTEHGILKVISGLGEEDFEHRICAVRGTDTEFVNRMNAAVRTYTVASARPGLQFPLFRLARVMKEFRRTSFTHVISVRLKRFPLPGWPGFQLPSTANTDTNWKPSGVSLSGAGCSAVVVTRWPTRSSP